MRPPVPLQHPFTRKIHHKDVCDPFSWIEDVDHPDTLPYLNAENAYTDHVCAPLEELRQSILTELLSRTSSMDQTAPYTIGEWTRYATIEKDQSYWVYRRKRFFRSNRSLIR